MNTCEAADKFIYSTGNNTMMPVFVDALSTPMVGDKALRKGCKNKEDSFVSTTCKWKTLGLCSRIFFSESHV